MSELVSVLLPVYKEELSWVQMAIKSICNQSYTDLEIVVGIDNPDRNDVVNWIDELNDNRIKLYVNEVNVGLVQNLNKGLDFCTGEYIARMDADDISMENRLSSQIQYLKDNELDLVASNTIIIDNDGNRLGESNIRLDDKSIGIFLKRLGSFPHPTWLARKEVFTSLNGYREICLAEDYDFLIRCYLSGFQMGILDEPALFYRQNLNGITQADKGKQRVTALVLRKQLLEDRIFDLSEVNKYMDENSTTVGKYRKLYSYSRYIRLLLLKRERLDLKKIKGFKVYFIMLALKDFWIEKIS